MDPELLLSKLKIRLGDLILRKKKLDQIILAPKIVAGILGAGLAEYLAWLTYDDKNSGIAWFVGLYGLIFGIGGALALVKLVAGWLGFPNEEYEALDAQISRLHHDTQKIGRYIWAIDDIKQLQPHASPSQNVTLNGHIERLKKATEESFIQPYDSSAFEYIRRSVGAIRGHIKRNNVPETKAPPTEMTDTKTITSNLPAEKKPSLTTLTPPASSTASKDESLASSSIAKSPKSETQLAAKRQPETAKIPSQVVRPTMADILRSNRLQKPEKIYTENPAPSSTELDISTVFSPRPTSVVKKMVRMRRFQPAIKGMVNYLELYIKNRDIGQQGEQFVLNYEKEYLLKNNRKDLADQVSHVSLDNDALGYDILSFDLTGAQKYIEVKTTNAGHESQFFLSINETQMMGTLPNYFIYRVYNFDRKSQTGLVYKINCAKDFDKYFRLETAVYKVIPNVG